MDNVDIDLSAAISKDGEVRIAHKLHESQFESLVALEQSPYWKFYRQLLVQSKDAHVNSMLQMTDPNQMVKMIGFVAGLNFAINQLPVLCAEYKKNREQALAKDKEKKIPFKRG